MKIINLTCDSRLYTCNAYLLLGEWNTLNDVNTLIDAGSDPEIINTIKGINTGVGKNPIEQIVITHGHSDHNGALPVLREAFSPVVRAFISSGNVDAPLHDGQKLHIADTEAQIIHTPCHSQDSICVYFRREKILFAGDTPLAIRATGGVYTDEYIGIMERLARFKINDIYFGHGEPIIGTGAEIIRHSLNNVIKSKITP